MGTLERFRQMHIGRGFVMPNPWDAGSAIRLESMGFTALATTSSGHAASLGRVDQQVSADEMIEHAAHICAAVSVPVNIDSERLFADSIAGVRDMVAHLAGVGAAGCSIEDYDPRAGAVDPVEVAVERVAAAAGAASDSGIVLTARAESLLYGSADLDDVIERLVRYRAAGADVVYAPGLDTLEDVNRVLSSVEAPVNVLLRPSGPSVSQLLNAGVARISTGGALAATAYEAMEQAASKLLA